MADPGLVQALDYILNKSDEGSIEVLAEAIVRRRKNLQLFSAVNIPDPQMMAKDLSEQITAGSGLGVDAMRQTIREMIFRLIREHAPELSDKQMQDLCEAWLPEGGPKSAGGGGVPKDVMLSMIEQFIAFSQGEMQKSVDDNLRDEMGAWPERYWKAFPPVIQQIIRDYLKNNIAEKDFRNKIALALK